MSGRASYGAEQSADPKPARAGPDPPVRKVAWWPH